MAKELEFAGKEDRIDYIREHHDELMEYFGRLKEELEPVFKDNAAKPQ